MRSILKRVIGTVNEGSRASGGKGGGELRLADVGRNEPVELVDYDLPEAEVESLLEKGILPGCTMCTIRYSPFGDPVVLIDGTMLALRKELARCLCVRRAGNGRG